MPALVAVIIGLAFGWGRGGSLRNLGLRHWPFMGTIAVLYLLQALFRGRLPWGIELPGAVLLWLASSVVLAGLLFVARPRPSGFALLGVGVILNAVVVAANGAMPVQATGIRDSGFYRTLGPETRLAWLGDTINLGIGSMRFLLSAGDLIMLLGLVITLATAMSPPSNRKVCPDSD